MVLAVDKQLTLLQWMNDAAILVFMRASHMVSDLHIHAFQIHVYC